MAVDLDNAKHRGLRLYADLGDLVLEVPVEKVAGGAGFVNASGTVALDLTSARAFHSTMTGNITGLSFTNVPDADVYSASWQWVLRIDATGGYTLSGTPTVTFVDGSSFAKADLTANAENIFTFWQVGTTTYGALVTNGTLELDPFVLSFATTGSQVVDLNVAQTLILPTIGITGSGSPGDGVTYAKNGVSTSGTVAFAAGDVLTVTVSSLSETMAVRIRRFL